MERLEAAGCRVEVPVNPPEWARAEPGREEAVVGREERSGTRERREGGERHAYEAHTGGKWKVKCVWWTQHRHV